MVPWWTQTQSRQKLHLIISGEKRTLQSVDNNINKKNGNKNQKTQKQTNRQFEMQQIIVLSFSARLLCETDKHLGRQVCRQVDRQARTNGQHNRGRETKDWIDLKKLQQPQHNTTTTTPRINSQTHEHKTQHTIYTQGPALHHHNNHIGTVNDLATVITTKTTHKSSKYTSVHTSLCWSVGRSVDLHVYFCECMVGMVGIHGYETSILDPMEYGL